MAGRMRWLALLVVGAFVPLTQPVGAGVGACGLADLGTSILGPGSGVIGDPYTVDSAADLAGITGSLVDCHFRQTRNITLSGSWTPIGPASNVFSGSYDGQGYAISGLSIAEGGEYLGLFGAAEFAEISNLSLVDVSVSGTDYVGGLLGSGRGTAISNVSVSGTVSGRSQVGGIVGGLGPVETTRSNLIGARSAVVVGVAEPLNSSGIGGVVGYLESSDVAQVSASGAVTGVIDVGGIVGHAVGDSTVRYSRSSGTVSGSFEAYPGGVGGIVGTMAQSHIFDSYSSGAVTATGTAALAGGIAGFVEGTPPPDMESLVDEGDVERVYAVGEVSGETYVGALIGYLDLYGTVVDSHWSSAASGTDAAIGANDSGAGDPTGSTLDDLHQIDTYVGWTIDDRWTLFDPPDDVWGICDGDRPPYLLWERSGSPCGWTVTGFLPPVDMDKVLNVAQAGRVVPLMWRIVDGDGVPVSDPSSFVKIASRSWGCAMRTGTVEDGLEKYAAPSGMRYLGSGLWQFSWATSKTWAGQCRTVTLELSDGSTISADFKFRR